jgi:lipopolysaccharide export system permease protein
LDLDLTLNLLKNYLLTFGFLTVVYLIFTAFELWKFAGTIDNGINLLTKYLFFLIPFIYIELAPTALMIATLTTYIIKSRQNEIVTWTAAGLSIYRLLFPCFILMIAIGVINFGIQEWVLSEANQKQDSIRDQIRSRNITQNNKGKFWIASDNKIFEFEKGNASDNDKGVIKNLAIYEFSKEKRELRSILKAEKARWIDKKIKIDGKAEKIDLRDGEIKLTENFNSEITEKNNPFAESITKPTHLNIKDTKIKIENSVSVLEKRTYEISLQKKYATPFIPFIIILFTTPFALSIGRKGNVITIGYAVVVWLLFMGVTNIFVQLGQSGYLSAMFSIWSPLILFSLIGMFLLTKVKT